jgi:hypothetical protein
MFGCSPHQSVHLGIRHNSATALDQGRMIWPTGCVVSKRVGDM